MPVGVALIGWTNKEGFFLIKTFPDFTLSDEEVMQIGSLHRMRNLKPNFITLNTKSYKIASFFSGMATHRYYIAPNFVISLILKKEESGDYSKMLPVASRLILEKIHKFNPQEYQNRTLRISDVLDLIGTDYMEVLPKIFMDLSLGNVPISQEELDAIFEDEDIPVPETTMKEIQEKLDEKDRGMALYEKLIETQKEKIKNLEEEVKNYRAEIESLSSKIDILNDEIKISFERLEKERNVKNNLEQQIFTYLQEYYNQLSAELSNKSKIFGIIEDAYHSLLSNLRSLFEEKELRVMLLGNKGVGKKTVLNLLVNKGEDKFINYDDPPKLHLTGDSSIRFSVKDLDSVSMDEILEFKPVIIAFVTDSKLKDIMQVLQVYKNLETEVETIKFCILANKQDEPGASSPEAISKFFNFPILGISAINIVDFSRILDFFQSFL
ncbi:MAG: hypothetical protein ACTSSI_00165 [Candidatus Helarchaeota archaeon]